MEYNNLNMLDMFLTKESLIKSKYSEIERLYKDREELRKGCPDNIVVCVNKNEIIMGKDKFSNDKNICLICGKEVNLIKKDMIVIDMSNYKTGIKDNKDDIDYKLYVTRYEYIDIIKNNPNISKDDLYEELNKRIFGIEKEKVLEKINN